MIIVCCRHQGEITESSEFSVGLYHEVFKIFTIFQTNKSERVFSVNALPRIFSEVTFSRLKYTVELRFLEPPRETKIGSRNWEVRNIGGKITVKQVQRKQLFVRVIGFFEKSRVREIEVPL